MSKVNEIDLIAAELEKVNGATEYGPLGVKLAASFVAGVPFVGAPLGVLLELVGNKKIGPDLKELLTRSVWEIQQIVPEIEKIGGLHERIQALENGRDDPRLMPLLERAAADLVQAADDAVLLNTVGSELSAKNVTVENREFSSAASAGAFVDLSGLCQTGAKATISTFGLSRQVLDGASFSRSDSQAMTLAQMGQGVSHIGGKTEYNVREDGTVVGVRHTSNGEHGFGMKIEMGPDGPKVIFG